MESNRRVFRQNMAAGALVTLTAAAAYYATYYMPRRVALFPRLGTGAMAALGLFIVVLNLWRHLANAETGKKPVEAASFLGPLAVTAVVVAYAAAISVLGFYSSTVAAMAVMMWGLGQRSATAIAVVTAVVTALVYFFFTVQLRLPLPAGLLI